MLQLSRISKSYGGQSVLDSVSFEVKTGERAGLVGPNGSGKTTLLRIIAELEPAEAGSVSLPPGATLGYLPQGQVAGQDETIQDLIRSALRELRAAQNEMEEQARRLAGADANDAAMASYADAVARFEALGGYEIEHRIEEVLTGLGLGEVPREMRVTLLSGGQRTRLGLALLLLSSPGLLLLDEPTNHLDVQALEWLEDFLRRSRSTVLIVSHDRVFLDRAVTRILELDDATHRVRSYPGNYTDYEVAKEREREVQLARWVDQQQEIARLKTAAGHLRGLAQFRKGGKADSGDKFAKGFFANRGLETVRRAKQIERRIERLETEDKVDKPAGSWQIKLEFGAMPRSGQIVITLENLGQAFDNRWLFRGVSQTLRHGERVALMGANGTGKTTLLRIMIGQLVPSEGQVRPGANVRIGYMAQEQEDLDPEATPLSLIRGLAPLDETRARHFLHLFLFQGDEVFTPIARLSYGERARLILARLVVSQTNCLVLDEPINHLDIPSRERFEAALEGFPGTIIVAAHDRAFIDRFATRIWSLEKGTLRTYPDREAMRGG